MIDFINFLLGRNATDIARGGEITAIHIVIFVWMVAAVINLIGRIGDRDGSGRN